MKQFTHTRVAALQVHRARQALMMFALSFATFCLFAQMVRNFLE